MAYLNPPTELIVKKSYLGASWLTLIQYLSVVLLVPIGWEKKKNDPHLMLVCPFLARGRGGAGRTNAPPNPEYATPRHSPGAGSGESAKAAPTWVPPRFFPSPPQPRSTTRHRACALKGSRRFHLLRLPPPTFPPSPSQSVTLSPYTRKLPSSCQPLPLGPSRPGARRG